MDEYVSVTVDRRGETGMRGRSERRVSAAAGSKHAHGKRRAYDRMLEARLAGVLEERMRLAREIHDTLLQGVSGISLQLRAALPHLDSPPAAAETLLRIVELAEQTSRDARDAVWDMRPSVLCEGDLVTAVETAARRILAGTPVHLHFRVSGNARRLPSRIETVVLRIVQEAMSNVVKHAAARSVRLELTFSDRELAVSISDDGKGFAAEPEIGHWGLVNMRERASQAGGSLRVRSAPGGGTTVLLQLPLRQGSSVGRRTAIALLERERSSEPRRAAS